MTSPVLVRGLRQRRSSTRTRRRCSPTSTRARSTSTPRPPPPRSPSARARCCRSTSSATPPTCPAFEAHGLPIVEDACEALGARHADGTAVGARGHPAAFGFYANKQLTTGEGGMLTLGERRAQGARGLRAQPGPRAGHGLARPRPARLQLPDHRHPVRDRARAARAPGRDARRPRPRRRGCYREALAGLEGLELPCEDAGGDVRGWFVFVVQLPRGVRPRRGDRRGCASAACSPSPTCPAIHLMSFYRERFGHRPGEFPVCEDVAAALARAAVLPGDDRGPGRPRRRGARPSALGRSSRCRASRSRPTGSSRSSTPRSASTGGSGPTTSSSRARTRRCWPPPGSSPTPTATRCWPGWSGSSASSRTASSRSSRTTWTSTWRSSGG